MRADASAAACASMRQLLMESFYSLPLPHFRLPRGLPGLKIVALLMPQGALPEESVLSLKTPVLFATLALIFFTTILAALHPILHVLGATCGRAHGQRQNLRSRFSPIACCAVIARLPIHLLVAPAC